LHILTLGHRSLDKIRFLPYLAFDIQDASPTSADVEKDSRIVILIDRFASNGFRSDDKLVGTWFAWRKKRQSKW
jgi:hypothetical protein